MFPRLGQQLRAASVLGVALLACAAAPAIARPAAQDPADPGRAVAGDAMVALPDGRRLHLKCSGAGEPTIVLDAGLGLDSSIWSRIAPALAATFRTCAYDRAGYGRSDPGPLPRDSARRTDDLLGLLEAVAETGPFVLVAHSAAERPARLAAGRRPDLIAGLVLIDPGADLEVLKAIAPVWAAAYDAGLSGALECIRATAAGEMRPGNAIYIACGSPPTEGPLASREMAAAVLSENEPEPPGPISTPPAGSLGDLPVIVLTAGDKFEADEGAAPDETLPLRQAWTQAGAAIAAASRQGEQRMVPGASHVIQFEQPQAVIDAVRDVAARVRTGTVGPGPAS
jgi:pimeloyl-ACP methyl ester carboxylesterase